MVGSALLAAAQHLGEGEEGGEDHGADEAGQAAALVPQEDSYLPAMAAEAGRRHPVGPSV